MKPVLTAVEMQLADRAAAKSFHISEACLMELAGKETLRVTLEQLGCDSPADMEFLVVAGRGNNGGDGFVIARHLLNLGAAVDLVLLYPDTAASGAAAGNLAILESYLGENLPLRIFRTIQEAIPYVFETSYRVIFDAMTGTGLKISEPGMALRSPLHEGIELLNSLHERTPALTAAVDIPSGLDATSGFSAESVIEADFTVTMAFLKTGLLLNDGPRAAGEVAVAEISIPKWMAVEPGCMLVDELFAAEHFVLRPEKSAKHQNGKVLIVAGSHSPEGSMAGAAILSAGAAVKTGAGYLAVALPSALASAMHMAVPEAVVINQDLKAITKKAAWADTILIGPGLGRGKDSLDLVEALLTSPEITSRKLIFDADALYAIAERGLQSLLTTIPQVLLTPHYGEFAKLAGTSAEEAATDPIHSAMRFSGSHGTAVLLKGTPTLIANPSGTALLNTSGTEALATAGTGDVLSGIIAALSAKGETLADAAGAAAWLHGRAGDLAANVSSLVSATMVLDSIPAAIEELFDFESDS
ncbi:MAG: NAD(P)H-hydrate dehydratase [Chlorobium sp.]|nr:NAD(P)H-hydrate dehydratase [Chlorobium sp.]